MKEVKLSPQCENSQLRKIVTSEIITLRNE